MYIKIEGKKYNRNFKMRGYCGYHISWDNKRIWLRSKGEFIFASYLDSIKEYYLCEKKTYTIDEYNYKPDFIIYKDSTYTEIKKIVEIKSGYKTYDNMELYEDIFKPFILNLNIDFEIFFKHTYFDSLIKKLKLEEKLKKWIDDSINIYSAMDRKGERNPSFGVSRTDETKRKIGDKTIERCKNPEYIKKHSESIKNFYETNKGIELKKKLSDLRKEEHKIKKELLEKKLKITDPLIEEKCVICGDNFLKRSVSESDRKTCRKNGCTNHYNNLIGKERKLFPEDTGKNSFKTRYLNYFIKIQEYSKLDTDTIIKNLDKVVDRCRKTNIIPKYFGINMNTIIKFFNSVDNFKQQLELKISNK